VIDANGCMAEDSFEILTNEINIVDFQVTPTNCSNQSSGEIDITLDGLSGPYLYNWNTGDR